MKDSQASAHIQNPTTNEEKFYGKKNLTEDYLKHLHQVPSELEQCWDYPSQHSARRDAEENLYFDEIQSIDRINNYQD